MISRLYDHEPLHPAIISGGDAAVVNYEQLWGLIETNRQILAGFSRPALAMLCCENSIASIVAYLGCLAARVPVCLVEPHAGPLLRLVQSYRPSLVIASSDVAPPAGYRDAQSLATGNYRVAVHPDSTPYASGLHESLALLLPTSGSTGNPKLVRLSRQNVVANARSIAGYLQLGPGERSVQGLPMHYAYGLSLINSHLFAGGAVVLNPHSFMQMEFWSVFDRTACTSFAGVPYMYQLLRRLNFNPAARPTLRTLTQAGGGLAPELISHYHQTALRNKSRFFVMYGQTEATARIAYVPPDRLGDKIGAIGVPIPGGALALEPVDGLPGAEQLVYHGPNVMLGYAAGPPDLALGDVCQGRLRTADLGRVDDEGFFYALGRLQRMAKIFGRRMNLGDIEDEVERQFDCRAVALESENKLHVLVEPGGDLELPALRQHVARFLAVRPHVVRVELTDHIPMTSAGKKDYRAFAKGTSAEKTSRVCETPESRRRPKPALR